MSKPEMKSAAKVSALRELQSASVASGMPRILDKAFKGEL